MKSGKAPGLDGIPPEIVKEIIKIYPDFLLKLLNGLLRKQELPTQWKIAKVILLLQDGKSRESPKSYRPICLLDPIGKLYELMIRARLEDELQKGRRTVGSAIWLSKGKINNTCCGKSLGYIGRIKGKVVRFNNVGCPECLQYSLLEHYH
ncbi:hypothetical protein NQ314_014448 [Rhamnusium bicolor]|uniref:Reverse transcriptase domain-containing protein n=1 Tax=Rhamnusium bicolor TaxID=1586634 RepID=A0AAV8X1Z3_9CUCU|nr:hypothetical protein NQ314_014448 [Rhamnusium bicolor]